jgi:hypothetical protein
LVIHIAALWGMISPDVLAVVKVTDSNQRSQIVRDAVEALLG